jgi:hypothetical protein
MLINYTVKNNQIIIFVTYITIKKQYIIIISLKLKIIFRRRKNYVLCMMNEMHNHTYLYKLPL